MYDLAIKLDKKNADFYSDKGIILLFIIRMCTIKKIKI